MTIIIKAAISIIFKRTMLVLVPTHLFHISLNADVTNFILHSFVFEFLFSYCIVHLSNYFFSWFLENFNSLVCQLNSKILFQDSNGILCISFYQRKRFIKIDLILHFEFHTTNKIDTDQQKKKYLSIWTNPDCGGYLIRIIMVTEY